MKKFKIIKSETGEVVYKWAYKCPTCKGIVLFNFGARPWVFESGGLSMECELCGKFGQVVTKEDVTKATLISSEEWSKLDFGEKKC